MSKTSQQEGLGLEAALRGLHAGAGGAAWTAPRLVDTQSFIPVLDPAAGYRFSALSPIYALLPGSKFPLGTSFSDRATDHGDTLVGLAGLLC